MLPTLSLPVIFAKRTTYRINQTTLHTYTSVLPTMDMGSTAFIGEYDFLQKSAPIHAISNKDIGLSAISKPHQMENSKL